MSGSLIIHWCPRCKVQSDTRWHQCLAPARLYPQSGEETRCIDRKVALTEYLSVRALEQIRDHANSAEDAAMMAQKELDRIQKTRTP
jgi:hypothetical protein